MASLRLGDLLLRRGLITNDQLEQALQAQRTFGGRVGTNLVEMGFITEDQLAQCLSQQLGVPYVRPESIASIPRDVIQHVPRELVEQYRFIPLRFDDRGVDICVADPNDLEKLDELRFALNCAIHPHVITEVTLNYALERYYGVRRQPRFFKMPGAEPVEMRLMRVGEEVVDRAAYFSHEAQRATEPAAPKKQATTEISLLDRLSAAAREDEVLDILLQMLVPVFPHVVLLAVRGGQAQGLMSASRTGAWQAIADVNVVLKEGTLLHDVLTRALIAYRAQVGDAAVLRVATRCQMASTRVSILPVFDNRIPAYVALAQGIDENQLKAQYEYITGVLARVSCAFHVVALRKEIRAPLRRPASVA